MIPFFSCIFARDLSSGGIGFNGQIPWSEKRDMEKFKQITTENYYGENNICIMGRKTYENVSHLKNRHLFVVSSSLIETTQITQETKVFKNLKECLDYCSKNFTNKTKIFVIGGELLLRESFNHPLLETIYMTEVDHPELKYDVYFKDHIPPEFKTTNSDLFVSNSN